MTENVFITVPQLTLEQYWRLEDANAVFNDGGKTLVNYMDSIGIPTSDPKTASILANIIVQDGYLHNHAPKQESRLFWQRWQTKYNHKLDKTEQTEKSGYVYILQSEQYYKIGRTKDVTKRFPQIHIHLPFETRLVCLFWDKDCYHLESSLHQWYSNYRTNGEWFLLPYDEVYTLRLMQPQINDVFDMLIDEFETL